MAATTLSLKAQQPLLILHRETVQAHAATIVTATPHRPLFLARLRGLLGALPVVGKEKPSTKGAWNYHCGGLTMTDAERQGSLLFALFIRSSPLRSFSSANTKISHLTFDR